MVKDVAEDVKMLQMAIKYILSYPLHKSSFLVSCISINMRELVRVQCILSIQRIGTLNHQKGFLKGRHGEEVI